MPWLPITDEEFSHDRTIKVAELLGCTENHAFGLIVRFWFWCLKNSSSGRIPENTDFEKLATRLRAKTGGGKLFDAFQSSGVLKGTAIVDWDKTGGQYEKKIEQNRERVQKSRIKAKQDQCNALHGSDMGITPLYSKDSKTLKDTKDNSGNALHGITWPSYVASLARNELLVLERSSDVLLKACALAYAKNNRPGPLSSKWIACFLDEARDAIEADKMNSELQKMLSGVGLTNGKG